LPLSDNRKEEQLEINKAMEEVFLNYDSSLKFTQYEPIVAMSAY